MSVQHKSLKDEILFILGRASEPLDSGQIYERCTLAEEIKRVTDALWILRNEGKIAFAEGEGRKRYVLASGVAAPAPAGKAGRPEKAAPPAIGDPGIGLNGAAGKARRANPRGEQVAKLLDTDAECLADALISKTREQLAPGSDYARSPRWSIDQSGAVTIHSGQPRIYLNPLQARVLAEMVLVMHDVLEQHA